MASAAGDRRPQERGAAATGTAAAAGASPTPAASKLSLASSHRSQETKSAERYLSDFCYSISNLILILGCLVALACLIKFVQDEPLYEYGEHVLSLGFYRQLVYIIVIVPLLFLVALLNAALAFFGPQASQSPSKTILSVKIVYQTLMILLVLLALVFVAPSIRANELAKQIELELRKHMKLRYENTFSYEFLDRIQEQYECCDELWYRANMQDHLPISCFKKNSNYSEVFDRTCSDALGSLVSTRCLLVAASLSLVLIALVVLLLGDLRDWTSRASSSRKYNLPPQSDWRPPASGRQPADSISSRRSNSDEFGEASEEENVEEEEDLDGRKNLIKELTNRLRNEERQRDTPLLGTSATLNQLEQPTRQIDEQLLGTYSKTRVSTPSSPILTRANYNVVPSKRSQSPVFVQAADASKRRNVAAANSGRTTPVSIADVRTSTSSPRMPIKSALKKTPSFQQIDTSNKLTTSGGGGGGGGDDDNVSERSLGERPRSCADDDEDDADSLDEYAQKLRQNSTALLARQQQQPTRRSLLNVRFADE